MRITQEKPKSTASGMFFTFSASDLEQVNVKPERESPLRFHVLVELPNSKQNRWPAYIQAVIRRLSRGFYQTIRFDYSNVIQFLTMSQMQLLDNAFHEVSFHLYGAPKEVLPKVAVSHFNVDQIKRNVDREKYASTRKKQALGLLDASHEGEVTA